MTSRSNLTYAARAELHPHPLAQRLFRIAEEKRSNLVFSADYTDAQSLLKAADEIGPIIAVLKTHVDMVKDFEQNTMDALNKLSKTHDFLIFENRKLVDIGSTVQKQYHEGTLQISEFAHIVNFSLLGGEGIADALDRVVTTQDFPHPSELAFVFLAEMTSKGSFATGEYTEKCVELARKYTGSMIGWVATRSLSDVSPEQASDAEDFLVFTTGVNLTSKGDDLGQQYQTPATAITGGSNFLIAGRGIYASGDPLKAAEKYRKEGWDAYLRRVGKMVRWHELFCSS